jgi:hypothetical protein
MASRMHDRPSKGTDPERRPLPKHPSYDPAKPSHGPAILLLPQRNES